MILRHILTLKALILLCLIAGPIVAQTDSIFYFQHSSKTYFAFPELQTRKVMRQSLDLKTCTEEVTHYRTELVKAEKIIELKDSIEAKMAGEILLLNNIVSLKDNQLENKGLQVDHFQSRFRKQRRQKWGVISLAGLVGAGLVYLEFR